MRLTYHPHAEAELIKAGAFYQPRSQDLVERFLQAFQTAIDQILENPDRWMIIENEVRCQTMKRFPYSIYYRIEASELFVVAIKHHCQHPRILAKSSGRVTKFLLPRGQGAPGDVLNDQRKGFVHTLKYIHWPDGDAILG
jgi:toxin ParE1/3/4